MRNMQFRSTSFQYRLPIGLSLIALLLFVSIIIGLIAPHGDSISLFRNILASVAILVGLFGLFVFAARQFDWPLPSILQVPRERQDQNWRLLVMSFIAIAVPFLVLLTQSFLFH